MTGLRTAWAAFIDRQHRFPSGVAGQIIGERMLRQHAVETAWSIELLRLRPSDRFLELGCGAGRALALAVRQLRYGHAMGMDVSPTMLRAAAWRNRRARRRGQLTLLRGDLARLPVAERRFDRILSIHTLYFWPDPGVTSRRLAALLVPGGRLVTTFATAKTLRTGEREYWPIHELAAAVVEEYRGHPEVSAVLLHGPDARQFNNVALVLDRA